MSDLFETQWDFVVLSLSSLSYLNGVFWSLFQSMGFTHVARHRSKDTDLWRQGISTFSPITSPIHLCVLRAEHGPSACALGFRVRDAQAAYALATEGAQPIQIDSGFSSSDSRSRALAVRSFISSTDWKTVLRSTISIFTIWTGDRRPVGCGFNVIDHRPTTCAGVEWITGQVLRRLLNFREIRFFDIKGITPVLCLAHSPHLMD